MCACLIYLIIAAMNHTQVTTAFVIWPKSFGTPFSALSGMLVSLILVPSGVQRAELMMVVCSALVVFAGLRHIMAAESPEPKKEGSHDL